MVCLLRFCGQRGGVGLALCALVSFGGFFGGLFAADSPALLDFKQEDFRAIVARAKERVFPAVVYIHCVNENTDYGKQQRQTSAGSGVVINGEGEVVTNWHVVEKALEVRCLLNDGRAFTADLVGSDKDTDLALLRLRIPDGERLPMAALDTGTALTEGDFVMALGAPWGLNRSVSFGIISCVRRYLPESSEYSAWLQTDAAISPGNSGGPLVSTDGRVVGINARGALLGGNLGFAIPAATVAVVIPRLREYKQARWAWTGLQLQPIRDFQRNIYFDGDDGVIVADTDADSPARAAGFLPNDRLLAINGQPVRALMEEDLPGVRLRIALLPQDKPSTFRIRRGKTESALVMQPRAKGKVTGEELVLKRWDFTLKNINQFEVPELHFQCKSGVYVSGIDDSGNSSESGLRHHDILLSVNGQPTPTLEAVRKIHEETLKAYAANGTRRIILSVLRAGRNLQLILDISRDNSEP
ncbi:MAG: trypsin-like peptidase domain-containing protein [Puniceicoccales bacterium]|jgi:serine protease Do|nr:trypsin-like peptidase domain-containing protein [Puniceicoccales bacterium]